MGLGAPNLAAADSDISKVADIRDELAQVIGKIDHADRMHPDVDTDTLRRLDHLIRELSKCGTRHVIDLGLQAIASATTSLLLRLQALASRELDQSALHSGDASKLLPPDRVVDQILPTLDSLAHLHMELAGVFGKFQHVCSIAEGRAKAALAPAGGPMDPDSQQDGRVPPTAHKAGRTGSKARRTRAGELRLAVST